MWPLIFGGGTLVHYVAIKPKIKCQLFGQNCMGLNLVLPLIPKPTNIFFRISCTDSNVL